MINKYACPFCNAEFEWDDDDPRTLFECSSCGKKMSAPKPAFSKGEKIGGYIINRRIGIGGMGEVYTAEQISMQRTVALKILQSDLSSDRTYLERFLREVRMLAQIEHPNIVRAIEAGADGDKYFFSMSYVNGKDLKRLLDEGKKFSEKEALKIALDVARALKYVWDKHKLLHRDVKPANIMLTQEDEVKLMDLGISKKLSGEDSELTMAGMMVGSPQYISPEQAKAQKDLDFRADMYSLGASLFHILTGQTPYPGESGMTVVAHHLSSPVPDPRKINSSISKSTAEMIMKMLAKNKEDRYASWDEVIEEIELIIEEIGRKQKSSSQKVKTDKQTVSAGALRRKSILFSNPLYLAIFAISIAFVIIGMYYVVRKSKIEAKERRAKELYEAAVAFYQKHPEPENFRQAVALFDKVIKTGDPVYTSKAKKEIDSISQRSAAIKEESRKALINAALDDLKKKSYEYEVNKKWDSAIMLWESYRRSGQFASELEKEISRAIDYLKRKKSEEENE